MHHSNQVMRRSSHVMTGKHEVTPGIKNTNRYIFKNTPQVVLKVTDYQSVSANLSFFSACLPGILQFYCFFAKKQ
jgi:hypothetical protein